MYIYTKTGPTSTPTMCVPLPTTPDIYELCTTTGDAEHLRIVYDYFHYGRVRLLPLHRTELEPLRKCTLQRYNPEMITRGPNACCLR